MIIVPLSEVIADGSPKTKLIEILGLPKEASIDERLFDLLVEKLEELGVEEEDLSDGYEFMGGSSALNTYINKNASRLVVLMGGELDVEDKIEEKNEILKKKHSPKTKLIEILGLPRDASIDEKLFDLLVEKLEELGVEEEDLSDGYEFMGGSSALNSYINKNASRLVVLMGGELDVEKKIEEKKDKEDISDTNEGFLFEQFDNIESDEKLVDDSHDSEPDIYTVGGYSSFPLILSKTTQFFDRNTSRVNGFNIVTPFRMKRLGRFVEIITGSKPGLLKPKAMFEIRSYYFERMLSDSVKYVFGGSSYFFIGFYNKTSSKGKETDFSFLLGENHFNTFSAILAGSTQIPLNLKNKNVKLYAISKATFMYKMKGQYTGWLDVGLSLRYELNSSKIANAKGLIKRRQTIID